MRAERRTLTDRVKRPRKPQKSSRAASELAENGAVGFGDFQNQVRQFLIILLEYVPVCHTASFDIILYYVLIRL